VAFTPGASDYQVQNAPSTNLIAEVAYNSATAPLVIDLSALILPHHQGLAFQYVITGGDVSGSVLIVTTNDGFQAILIPTATIAASQICVRPILGAAYVQGTPSTLSLTVTRATGINNQTGLIRVFGLTVLPLATEWNDPGVPFSILGANSVIVAAGTTVTCVAAPTLGNTYRIKSVHARSSGVHAAAALILFQGTTSANTLAMTASTGVNVEAYSWYPDAWWNEGVDFVNQTTGQFRAHVQYESWPLT
jgi:hypothetical protein